MRNYFTSFAHRAEVTYSHLRMCGFHLALSAGLAVGLVLTAAAGAQTPSSAGLSDAQAAVLLQALAKGQDAGAAALPAVQMQLLSQYLQRESQSAPAAAGINLARTEMLLAQGQAAASSGKAQAAAQMAGVTPGASVPSSPVGQKKPGIVRIGVVQPKAQMGQGNSGANVAESLRLVTIQYLSGPALDVIPIAAMLPAQIEAEMKQKECDYLLYSSISQKMKSGGFGMLQRAMPMANMIPMVGAVGGIAGAMASSAAGVAMSGAAGLSGSIKAKSELTYQYRLVAPGTSTSVLANSIKAKAKQDGEDIVTPLIEQAAGAILAEVGRKK
jgi:hypothetical protein